MIPRPPVVTPGSAPPWGALDPGALSGISLEHVRRALTRGKGEKAGGGDGDPAALGSRGPGPPAGGRDPGIGAHAAVLVALFEEGGEARVVLTRRAAHLRSHRGEVSFPGGRVDPGETIEHAAIREAQEEVGIGSSLVEVVGRLGHLDTLFSGVRIVPVVGVLHGRPSYDPNPAEVGRVFDAALSDLLSEDCYREERWQLDAANTVPMRFFYVPGETIWGATARILADLLALVLGV